MGLQAELESVLVQAVIIKYHRLVFVSNSSGAGKSKVEVLANLTEDLLLCLHVAEEETISLTFLLMRALILFMKLHPHDLISSQRPHFRIPSH